MLLTAKQVSNILDDVQQKFGHILGQTWTVAVPKIASLPDGTTALSDKLTIWNGKDTYSLDCNAKTCELSKLTFEQQQGRGIPFLWGCTQQVPDASRFATNHIGGVDAGTIADGTPYMPPADTEGSDAGSAKDSCVVSDGTCYVDAQIQDSDGGAVLQDIVSNIDVVLQDTTKLQDAADSSDTKDVWGNLPGPCNPLTSVGCKASEMCYITTGHPVCAQPGTLDNGDECKSFTDCKKGSLCVDSTCKQVCDTNSGSPICTTGACESVAFEPEKKVLNLGVCF